MHPELSAMVSGEHRRDLLANAQRSRLVPRPRSSRRARLVVLLGRSAQRAVRDRASPAALWLRRV